MMPGPTEGPRLWRYDAPPEPPAMHTFPPFAPPQTNFAPPQPHLEPSEAGMELICGIICNDSTGMFEQMKSIKKVVHAWTHTPEKLTPRATVDDLPDPR